jgi:hypothetical protein
MEFEPRHNIVRIVDIDGVIFEQTPSITNPKEIPLPGIERINEWFEEGDYIFLWSSRSKCYEDSTRKALDELGLRYHELCLGKPLANRMEIYDDVLIVPHHLPKNVGLVCLEPENG